MNVIFFVFFAAVITWSLSVLSTICLISPLSDAIKQGNEWMRLQEEINRINCQNTRVIDSTIPERVDN